MLALARTLLATNVTQDSALSPDKFALCLRALLRPSLALSPYEFAAYLKNTQFLLIYCLVIRGIYLISQIRNGRCIWNLKNVSVLTNVHCRVFVSCVFFLTNFSRPFFDTQNY